MLFIDIDHYLTTETVFLTDVNTVKSVAQAIMDDHKESINGEEPIKFKTAKLYHVSSVFFELLLRDKILYSMNLDTVRDTISIDTSKSVIKKNLSHAINKLYKSARSIEKSMINAGGDDNSGKAS